MIYFKNYFNDIYILLFYSLFITFSWIICKFGYDSQMFVLLWLTNALAIEYDDKNLDFLRELFCKETVTVVLWIIMP